MCILKLAEREGENKCRNFKKRVTTCDPSSVCYSLSVQCVHVSEYPCVIAYVSSITLARLSLKLWPCFMPQSCSFSLS